MSNYVTDNDEGIITFGWFLHGSVKCASLMLLGLWEIRGVGKFFKTETKYKLTFRLHRTGSEKSTLDLKRREMKNVIKLWKIERKTSYV